MLPALWPGDVVEIASCSLEDVRPGEIVLARREGRLFLHRLVGRFNDPCNSTASCCAAIPCLVLILSSLPKHYWAGWCGGLTKALTMREASMQPLCARAFGRMGLA